jgi:hypothetical protein
MLVQYSDDSGEEAPEKEEVKEEKSLEKDTKLKRRKKDKKRKKQKEYQEQQEEELAGMPNSPGPTSALPSMEDIMKGNVAFVWRF